MSVKSVLFAAARLAGGALAETWSIAETDVEGLERLQTEWGAFKAALEAATDDSFDFFPVSSRTAAAKALRAQSVGFVITGTAFGGFRH